MENAHEFMKPNGNDKFFTYTTNSQHFCGNDVRAQFFFHHISSKTSSERSDLQRIKEFQMKYIRKDKLTNYINDDDVILGLHMDSLIE